jgi:integrase
MARAEIQFFEEAPVCKLLTVRQTAETLGLSQTWVRRHAHELPIVRLGRNVRFDQSLLSALIQRTIHGGKSLEPERTAMPTRFQSGSVKLIGTKIKTWYGRYRQDLPDGERLQRKVRIGTLAQYPTKASAQIALLKIIEGEQPPDPKAVMTFKELAERWEKTEGATKKGSTLEHYQAAIRNYLLPTFGNRKIDSINREQIQLFLAKQATEYSDSSLRTMRAVLRMLFGWAVICDWLPKSPVIKIKLPRVTGGKKVVRVALTADQVTALSERLREPYATLVPFLYSTGLRIGEAVALKWEDFDGNLFHVRRRLFNGEFDTPKSKSSIRDLPIEDGLLARLKALGGKEYVFSSRVGTPIDSRNSLRRYIHPVAKELGITLSGWHDFRHSLTTQMRKDGVHPKIVSAVLGHSKVDLAMDVYDRVAIEELRKPLAMVATTVAASL